MKVIDIGDLKVSVCQHKGDINTMRYTKFKQYAPQFWEKMDSPLFEVYWEKINNFHNKGEHSSAMYALRDYKFALDNSKNSYDAWQMCFVLIAEEEKNEDLLRKQVPSDTAMKKTLEKFSENGLTADVVKESVLDFMQASPETFMDHLTLYGIQSTMSEIES